VLLGLSLFIIAGCRDNGNNTYQGYVEGEYQYISSPLGGRLEILSVARGKTVAAGQPLFTLDRTVQDVAVAEAEQGLQRAENRLVDLSKGLRPSEIEAIQAKLEQARAANNLARVEYERREKLLQKKVISEDVLDRSRAEMERSTAAVAQLQAELETARLGGRPDAIEAARTEVEAARQRLVQARWQVDQQVRAAQSQAQVFDTYYVVGEYVPPGHPVVSLLSPGNIAIRFFVPETLVGTLQPGQIISVSFDGSTKKYRAAISYISPQPEYTPPVIYSRNSRTHLVFMIEARPAIEDAPDLHPGQPVDVRLESPNG